MAQSPALISGTVRDAKGNPVAQARISFTSAPVAMPEVGILSDQNGAFTLAAPVAGTYELACYADGFTAETFQVTVASGEKVNHELTLRRQ